MWLALPQASPQTFSAAFKKSRTTSYFARAAATPAEPSGMVTLDARLPGGSTSRWTSLNSSAWRIHFAALLRPPRRLIL